MRDNGLMTQQEYEISADMPAEAFRDRVEEGARIVADTGGSAKVAGTAVDQMNELIRRISEVNGSVASMRRHHAAELRAGGVAVCVRHLVGHPRRAGDAVGTDFTLEYRRGPRKTGGMNALTPARV